MEQVYDDAVWTTLEKHPVPFRRRLIELSPRSGSWALAVRACEASLKGSADETLELAELPNVTLRLLPPGATIGDWYTPATSFSIYQFPDPDDPGGTPLNCDEANLTLTPSADGWAACPASGSSPASWAASTIGGRSTIHDEAPVDTAHS